MLLTLRCDPEREFCFYPVFFVGTPPFSLKRRAFFVLQRLGADFRCFWNVLTNPRNCPHCGQLCLPRGAHDTLAFSCFLAAASKISRFCPFRRVPAFAASGRSCPFRCISSFDRTRCAGLRSNFCVARRRNMRFFAPSGYAPGCARKIGHSRDTRLTRADRRFSAAPVGTLPTAFGCVPAHTLRPALQAFARKTAG